MFTAKVQDVVEMDQRIINGPPNNSSTANYINLGIFDSFFINVGQFKCCIHLESTWKGMRSADNEQ